MDFLPSYIYFIAISLLVSLLVYFRNNNGPLYLKLFPPFLLLTVAVETYGSYLFHIGRNNVMVYNFFSTFEFCFYLLFVSLIISSKTVKRIIYVTIACYTVAALANIIFILHLKEFHTTTYTVGCLLVALFCGYYFFELFRFPQSGKLQFNPAFWICTGLLFFYCCSFPLYALINQWAGISRLLVANFVRIVTILNIFLYLLFTIGFLCTGTRNYILSRS